MYIHLYYFILSLFQHKSDYEKLNSMHQVPSFVVDGIMLTQSVSSDKLYVTAVTTIWPSLLITAPHNVF